MNKQEQLKKLTWKYFWKQKFEECWLPALVIILIVPVLYGLSYLGRWINILLVKYGIAENLLFIFMDNFWKHIVYGIMALMVLFILSLFSFVIFLMLLWAYLGTIGRFIDWIQSNWELAKKRAKGDLKV